MRTIVSKFSNIGRLEGIDAQRKALVDAVNFELGLPAMMLDIGGDNVATMTNGVKVIGGRASDGPRFESVKAYLQRKWAVPGDNPDLEGMAGRITEVFHNNMPDMDIGYTQVFAGMDLRSSKQSSFDIIDTNAGITWTQSKPGDVVKPRRKFSEAKSTVGMLTFTAGLGIQDDWLRFQQWWNIEDAVAEFRAKGWDKKAEIHYSLLTTQGTGIDVAFDTDDTKTLNKAAAKILRAVKDKGYGASQNGGFVIVCAPEAVGRITKMLAATNGSLIVAYNANVEPVNVRVKVVVATTHVDADEGGYYLVLPGRKMKSATWTDQKIESVRNAYVRAEDMVGVQQFNAAIGDTDQIARVKFA